MKSVLEMLSAIIINISNGGKLSMLNTFRSCRIWMWSGWCHVTHHFHHHNSCWNVRQSFVFIVWMSSIPFLCHVLSPLRVVSEWNLMQNMYTHASAHLYADRSGLQCVATLRFVPELLDIEWVLWVWNKNSREAITAKRTLIGLPNLFKMNLASKEDTSYSQTHGTLLVVIKMQTFSIRLLSFRSEWLSWPLTEHRAFTGHVILDGTSTASCELCWGNLVNRISDLQSRKGSPGQS